VAKPAERVVHAAEQAAETVAHVGEQAAKVTEVKRPRQAAIDGLLLVLAGVAFAGIAAAVRSGRSKRTDLRATLAIQRVKHPVFSRLMLLVSWPGFPPQSRIIPGVLALGWWVRGYRLEAVFQMLAWGTGVVSHVFKTWMRRPRPDKSEVAVVIARVGGTSFPSGHVLNYLGIYGFEVYMLLRNKPLTPAKRVTAAALTGLIALVGASRMFLGHHWLTDVSASYLLGTGYLYGLTRLYERFRRRARSANVPTA
jgi:membrane-associated phospholipid phosphatase